MARRRIVPIALVLAALAVSLAVPPARATGGYDWPTYGFRLSRNGFDDLETTLTATTAPSLHQVWTADLAGVSITQPVVAAGVTVGGATLDLVYVGDEQGHVRAFDTSDGSLVWDREVGHVATACDDLPGGVFGVSGTPVLDRPRGRLYVAGGDAAVHALDLATGAEAAGWPVSLDPDPVHNHVWSALALVGDALFVPTAGVCDIRPYHGRIVKIAVTTASVAATWWVTGAPPSPDGGGIWGYGGVAAVPSALRIFAATGNAFPEAAGFAERVVALSTGLAVTASNHPSMTGVDVDLSSTPLLFQPPGCAAKLLAMSKTGELLLYNRAAIGTGPTQRIQVARNRDRLLLGVAAYSPLTHLVYVANPGPSAGGFRHGLVAFSVGASCRLNLAWQRTSGPNGGTTVSSPSIAGGVVYYGDGLGRVLHAFDATNGAPLWNSGRALGGAVFGAPSVANGRLYVVAWDGKLHCFAPA